MSNAERLMQMTRDEACAYVSGLNYLGLMAVGYRFVEFAAKHGKTMDELWKAAERLRDTKRFIAFLRLKIG